MLEAQRAAAADPERRARISAGVRKARADPELRVRASEATRASWTDPEIRARMSAALCKAAADRGAFQPPPELADLYRLIRHKLSAKEARRIVEDEMRRQQTQVAAE
jgi:hypothetical protein